jgi:hypothetical protein
MLDMAPENAERTLPNEGQNTTRTLDGDQKETAKRERSSIAFPYVDLDDALEVARAIHDHVGAGDCDDTQLSVWMNQSSKSSGYRMRLTAARMFGLLDPSSDRRKLTPLGRMVVDSRQERGAKADAFLKVPLYAALFERYKDTVLPPEKTLETEIAGLGVAEKQKGPARQVFARSAQQAGYFEHGKNRLVRPGVAPLADGGGADADRGKIGGAGGGSDEPPRHPFIEGLLRTLPDPEADDEWPLDKRVKWLQTAANIFDLIYKGEGGIRVEPATAQRSPRPHD